MDVAIIHNSAKIDAFDLGDIIELLLKLHITQSFNVLLSSEPKVDLCIQSVCDLSLQAK